MGIPVASRSALFSAPLSLNEIQHRERVLGVTRCGVALCSLAVLHFDRNLAGPFTLTANLLLLLYLLHSIVILWLLREDRDFGPRFSLLVHGSDILWPALIILYTTGPNSPFSAFFVVALIAAAYRWGLRETLGTALVSVLIFLSETAFVISARGEQFHLLRGRFHFTTFIVEIIGILLMGSLLGHLAEREEKLRRESRAIKQMIQEADPDADVNKTVEEILRSILKLLDADRVVLVLNNLARHGGVIWKSGKTSEGHETFLSSELSSSETARYFFPMPGKSWHLQRSQRGETYQILLFDAEGRRVEKASCSISGKLFSEDPFHTALGVSFTLGKEWRGRVFLFDSRNPSRLAADLHFLQELVAEVAPAVHGLYLQRRSQSRARAIERARVARDLHDGVIQSLVALEMQVDLLRRQTMGVSIEAAEKLERVRKLLQEEVINLRELTQQLKLDDLASQSFLARVAEMVDKFQRETGVNATFTSDFDAQALSPGIAREIAQIVREALTNVRKHSGARHVQVRLTTEEGLWKLVIEDDGKGFEFSGCLTLEDLETTRKGPQIIKERVRSIHGELAIESQPLQGSRLEIRFVPKAYGLLQ